MTPSTSFRTVIANFALHAPLSISYAFHIASPLSSIRPITSGCSGTGAAFLNTGNGMFTCMMNKRSQSLLQTRSTSSTARGLLGNDDNMDMYAPDGDDDDDNNIEIAGTADMEILRYRIARNKELGPGLEGCIQRPENVFIILFYPDTPDEGAHTIEFPKGSGNNLLLAFECEMECNRFAAFLEDQKFFDPSASIVSPPFCFRYLG